MSDQEQISVRGPITEGEASCTAVFAHLDGAWQFVGIYSDATGAYARAATIERELGGGYAATFTLYAPQVRARYAATAAEEARINILGGREYNIKDRPEERVPLRPFTGKIPPKVIGDFKFEPKSPPEEL